jgi:hypothetical protein
LSSTKLEPDDYTADCSADEDCVGVAFGDICDDDFCPCPTGAIHASAREAYDRDRAAISCPPWREVLLCRCVFTEAACVERHLHRHRSAGRIVVTGVTRPRARAARVEAS